MNDPGSNEIEFSIKNAVFIFNHYKFAKKCLLALIRTSGKSSALFFDHSKKFLTRSSG